MIRCIYKQKGLYNDKPFYKVGFVQPINKNGYEGEVPFMINIVKLGNIVRTYNISCSEDVFDFISVGSVYLEESMCFNSYGKLKEIYEA